MLRHELEALIDTIQPGEVVAYHTGNLMADRTLGPDFMRVENTARAAWDAMEAGKVRLVQARTGTEGVFQYLVIKRKGPFKKVNWCGCYDRRRNHHSRPERIAA